MNINYHTHNKLTSLEYTVANDINYENKTVVTGDLVNLKLKMILPMLENELKKT